MNRPTKTKTVLVIYNTDYDQELLCASGADVSAVREAAEAIRGGLRDHGYVAPIVGVHGRDLDVLFRRLADDPPDLVFNLVESLNGDVRNEALVPGILDMLRIPYTGAAPQSLDLCLHKDRAKEVLLRRNVATPPYRLLRDEADLEGDLDVDYPYFLKLAHEDASIGIEASNLVANRVALLVRAREMFSTYRQPLIAERYVEGREVNVTVLGNGSDSSILPLHEIDFNAMPSDRPHIVSYAAKWDESHIDYAGTKPVPMNNVSEALAARIEEVAKQAFAALELRDYGRVDLRIDSSGQPWVIDVNPNCDLSPDAGVARAAKFAGLEFPQLLGRICETAWGRL